MLENLVHIFSPGFLQEDNASHYPWQMCTHTAISLQKQGQKWLMISDLLFRSHSHTGMTALWAVTVASAGHHRRANNRVLAEAPRTSADWRRGGPLRKTPLLTFQSGKWSPRLFHPGFFLPNSISPPSCNYTFRGTFFISILVYIEFSFFKQIIQVTVLCD